MIIVKLMGGLGNQMFQYAFGLSISKYYRQKLYFDDSFFIKHNKSTDQFSARVFELSIFKELYFKPANYCIKKIINSRNRIVIKIRNLSRLINNIKQAENELIDFNTIKFSKINIFEGYFQSQKYFYEISDEVRSHFRFPDLDKKNKEIATRIINSNSVAIHIRRGDYATLKNINLYHGLLPLEYYTKAIKYISKIQKEPFYFVFSDDIDWVKENLFPSNENLEFIDGNYGSDSWIDMALMSFARHHIIANSSFSWWGAWLATGGGIVIAPEQWFNSEVARFNIDDFIPGNWIKLK